MIGSNDSAFRAPSSQIPSKRAANLRDYLSSVILEMRDNGYMYELQDKWFGFRMNIPSEGYLPEGAL